jgi:hypothetical protein
MKKRGEIPKQMKSRSTASRGKGKTNRTSKQIKPNTVVPIAILSEDKRNNDDGRAKGTAKGTFDAPIPAPAPAPTPDRKIGSEAREILGKIKGSKKFQQGIKVLRNFVDLGIELKAASDEIVKDTISQPGSDKLKFKALEEYKKWSNTKAKSLKIARDQTFAQFISKFQNVSTNSNPKHQPYLDPVECRFIGNARQRLEKDGPSSIISFCTPTVVDSPCLVKVCLDIHEVLEHIKTYKEHGDVPNPAYSQLLREEGQVYVDKMGLEKHLSKDVQEMIAFQSAIVQEYKANVKELMSAQELGAILNIFLPHIQKALLQNSASSWVYGLYRKSPKVIRSIVSFVPNLIKLILSHPFMMQGILLISRLFRFVLCVFFNPDGGVEEITYLIKAIARYYGKTLPSALLSGFKATLECGTLNFRCIKSIFSLVFKLFEYIPSNLSLFITSVMSNFAKAMGFDVSETNWAIFQNSMFSISGPINFAMMILFDSKASRENTYTEVFSYVLNIELADNVDLIYDLLSWAFVAILLKYVPFEFVDIPIRFMLTNNPPALAAYTEILSALKSKDIASLCLRILNEASYATIQLRTVVLFFKELFAWIIQIWYSLVYCRLTSSSFSHTYQNCRCSDHVTTALEDLRNRRQDGKDVRDMLKSALNLLPAFWF